MPWLALADLTACPAIPLWQAIACLVLALAFLALALIERRRRAVLGAKLAAAGKKLHEVELALGEQSRQDLPTGAGSRKLLAEDLPGRLSMARRAAVADWPDHYTPRQGLGLFIIDLDGFRAFNEAHGPAVGDALLRAVTNALRHAVRQEDMIVRWGDDEFLVVGTGMQRDGVVSMAGKLLRAVSEVRVPDAGGVLVGVGASLGFCPYPLIRRGAMPPEQWPLLVKLAGRCVTLAKQRGRGRCCGMVWSPTYQEEVDEANVLSRLLVSPTGKQEGLELLDLPG